MSDTYAYLYEEGNAEMLESIGDADMPDASGETFAGAGRVVYQLPSLGDFPSSGNTNALYIDKSSNQVFRWDASAQTYQLVTGSGGGSYVLPVATSSALGGVKADAATSDDNQAVRIDADGKLKTKAIAGMNARYKEDGGILSFSEELAGTPVSKLEAITAEPYSSTKSYTVGILAIEDNQLWKCTQSNTGQRPYDGSLYWEKTTVSEELANGGTGGAVSSVNGKTGVVVLNADDVGALPDDTPIPTTLADLTADSTHRTVTDAEKNTWNSKNNTFYVQSAAPSDPKLGDIWLDTDEPAPDTLALKSYVDNKVASIGVPSTGIRALLFEGLLEEGDTTSMPDGWLDYSLFQVEVTHNGTNYATAMLVCKSLSDDEQTWYIRGNGGWFSNDTTNQMFGFSATAAVNGSQLSVGRCRYMNHIAESNHSVVAVTKVRRIYGII